jgi:hypothetical protein
VTLKSTSDDDDKPHVDILTKVVWPDHHDDSPYVQHLKSIGFLGKLKSLDEKDMFRYVIISAEDEYNAVTVFAVHDLHECVTKTYAKSFLVELTSRDHTRDAQPKACIAITKHDQHAALLK